MASSGSECTTFLTAPYETTGALEAIWTLRRGIVAPDMEPGGVCEACGGDGHVRGQVEGVGTTNAGMRGASGTGPGVMSVPPRAVVRERSRKLSLCYRTIRC